MNKSQHNLGVIQNFILHLTHCGDHGLDEGFKIMEGYTPEQMYEVAKEYIKEDHCDGEDNPENFIPTFSAESSFQHEDKEKEHVEQIVIVADFGEDEGTQTVAIFGDPEDLEVVNDLLEFVASPYEHKM